MADKKVNRSRLYTILMLALLIGTGFWSLVKSYQKDLQAKDTLIAAYTSGLQQSINKLGQQVTARRTIEASYSDLKNLHVADSTELGRLKKIVQKNTEAATLVSVVTTHTIESKPKIITLPGDTTHPVYCDTSKTEWDEHVVRIGPEVPGGPVVSHIECTVKNEFEFTDTKQFDGHWPFRKPYLLTQGTNKNPNTRTTKLVSFRRKMPVNKARNASVAAVLILVGTVLGAVLAK